MSSAKIGRLGKEEAEELARKWSGYDYIDLQRIENRKKLCIACWKNCDSLEFRNHVKEFHGSSEHIIEISQRLLDVRYTQFCVNNVIQESEIDREFPSINKKEMMNFLASIGFVVELNGAVIDKPKRGENRIKNEISEIEQRFYEESTIRGIPIEKAEEIVEKYVKKEKNVIMSTDLKFSKAVVSNERCLSMSTHCSVYCHLCKRSMRLKNLKRHIMTSHLKWWKNLEMEEEKKKPELEDVIEILKKMAEIRDAMFYSSNLLSFSKIQEICDFNDDYIANLVAKLVNAGFVIDKENRGDREEMAIPIVPFENTEEMPKLEKETEIMSDDETVYSDRSSRSRSSSVVSTATSTMSDDSESSTSSISSLLSTSRVSIKKWNNPSAEQYPYCVLNAIPNHIKVEKALYSILEKMTDDMEYCLSQYEYSFLLGYTMYSIVVSNGSKMNVVSRMTMKSIREAMLDEESGLRSIRYSTKSTFQSEYHNEYICADDRIWRAIEIYECARERRIKECGMVETMMDDESSFFITYASLSSIIKDTNYPMSQFLRMCGIVWNCRGSAICSEAWSLVHRNNSKISSLQYCIKYFEMLREKEKEQIDTLDNGNLLEHPTIQRIVEININHKEYKNKLEEGKKKKKKRWIAPERRGQPPKKRGGDRKSKKYLESVGKWESEENPTSSSCSDGVEEEEEKNNTLMFNNKKEEEEEEAKPKFYHTCNIEEKIMTCL